MVPPKTLKSSSTCPHRTAHTEVEISQGVGLQIKTEGMKALGGIPVIIKILKKICLPIVIEIMKTGDLIISHGVDFFIHNLESQRFVQTGGKSFPFYILQLIIDIADDPYIPIPGTNRCGFSIGKEIECTNPHASIVFIVERYTNAVDHIGVLIIGGKLPFCNDGISPLGRTSLGQSG